MYSPPDITLWSGRKDTPHTYFHQIIQSLNLLEIKLSRARKQADVVFGILGFAVDEGVKRNQGRVGAKEGPAHIRKMLANLPCHRAHIQLFDAGDIVCKKGDLEAAQAALAHAINQLLKNHITPIVIGGGHELAFGHYQGIVQARPDTPLQIINFDAHFDIRDLLPNNLGSSGTPFFQIAQKAQSAFHYTCLGIQKAGNTPYLFQKAHALNIQYLLAETMMTQPLEKTQQWIDKKIKTDIPLYLSLCLDVFAQAYAPGVSAPQALGLTPWHVLPVLRTLAQSGRTLSYDIAELSPPFDKDNATAKLAAAFVFEIIHHHEKHHDTKS